MPDRLPAASIAVSESIFAHRAGRVPRIPFLANALGIWRRASADSLFPHEKKNGMRLPHALHQMKVDVQ